MDALASIVELIKSGGAYAVIVIFAYGILSGRIRLAREIERVEKILQEVKYEYGEDRERSYTQLERQQSILEALKQSVDREYGRRDPNR